MTSDLPEKYSAEEWERFRERFSKSILKTTEIAELGRSVGVSWPFKGSGETPAKYIQYDFEKLQSVPGLIGKKKRVHDLMDVLREILAFDDPFADMMDTVEQKSNVNKIYERALKKLEIPENYPVNLMYFSPETRKVLHQKGIKTLLEAIRFGQRTGARLEHENDLQSFLNGLSLINEATIKNHLPFRVGHTGLHLAEAVGLLVRNLSEHVQFELLYHSGFTLTESQSALREQSDKGSIESSLKVASVRFKEICRWFDKQVDELKQLCDSPESIERYFLPINDAVTERVAMALVLIHFGDSKTEKSGLFDKLSNLFKR